MTELYNEHNEIELISETTLTSDSGLAIAKIESTTLQRIKKGKRAMMTPMIAKYAVKGVINSNKFIGEKGLKEIMNKYDSSAFNVFIEETICGLMNDYGCIISDSSVTKLIYSKAKVSKSSFDRYMKLLRDNNVIRKVNNKLIVINPYQLYKNCTISGEHLWQLQANWELEKVMTHWFEIDDEARLDVLRSKAELDKAWAEEKLEKIKKSNAEVASIYEEPEKYATAIEAFTDYNVEKGLIVTTFADYLSDDTGSRHFRSWYLSEKNTTHRPKLQYDYKDRRAYADAFIEISK
jgi:hypothetical protein